MSLEIWTVYDHPADIPGLYVAWRWAITPGNPEPQPTSEKLTFVSLGALHQHFEYRGYHWMNRHPTDDPVILGTYC